RSFEGAPSALGGDETVERAFELAAETFLLSTLPVLEGLGAAKGKAREEVRGRELDRPRESREARLAQLAVRMPVGLDAVDSVFELPHVDRQSVPATKRERVTGRVECGISQRRREGGQGAAQAGPSVRLVVLGPEERGEPVPA